MRQVQETSAIRDHGFRQEVDGTEMVANVRDMGMEVCTTLGMITPEQAEKLKNAGLTSYNHNVDTSEEYYDKVITTRKYQDRLDTLKNVQDSGISVCSGGIIGMGNSLSFTTQRGAAAKGGAGTRDRH